MSQLTQVWREFFQESDEVNIVQIEDGSFWFQASHLCKSLDYKNTQVALGTHCEDYEIRKFDIGQHYDVNFVSESGFYSLVLGSKKPKAKQFKKWVCTDVLPKLRADGGYIMPTASAEQLEALHRTISDKMFVIEQLANDNKRLIQSIDSLASDNKEVRIIGLNILHAVSENDSADELALKHERSRLKRLFNHRD